MTAAAADVAVVPLHPERTDDPATLRWHLGRGQLEALVEDDDAAAVDAPLRQLVTAGVLVGFAIGPDSVATTLAPDQAWPSAGAAVRAAVQATVREQARRLDAAAPAVRDEFLARVARQVITEVVAPTAASHGGSVQFVDVRNGVITVRMRGACRGCPAASATLHGLLERSVRERVPWLATVQIATDGAEPGPVGTAGGPGARRWVSLLQRGNRPEKT